MTATMPPEPRTVVLVVTGSIAAYKSCEIVRRLRRHDVAVKVAMTRAATQFVGPTTLAALAGERVIEDLFRDPSPQQIPHVRWAEDADLLCVAPATADFIAKLAHGVADGFASTVALACRAPLLVAPAMEDDMFAHPAVQRNLDTLRHRGAWIVGPGVGELASGHSGPGRMAEPEEIAATADRLLAPPLPARWLQGRRVLVTAGPTRERLDPVRVFSNRSSGKMGYAMAAEAGLLGAKVTLVSGPTGLPAPAAVRVVQVESAEEMAVAVLHEATEHDVAILAAAVCDFRPQPQAGKIKKSGRDALRLELEPTTDILARLGECRDRPVLVGFAAESSEVLARATEKLEAKGCDLIVANRVSHRGAGLESEDNEVTVLDRLGGQVAVPYGAKRRVAGAIWEAVHGFVRRVNADEYGE